MRKISKVAQDWWDYTTLDDEILEEAERLNEKDIFALSREGFTVKIYDGNDSFYLAEAMEYINCWKKSTNGNPAGICGPVGPTEQLPLVSQIINDMEIDVREGHFWAMDEWFVDGKELPPVHPLSFTRTDLDLCFNRIDKRFRMPDENLHFMKADNLKKYSETYDSANCLIMQGGQGEVKHWAFNDPVKREGKYKDAPPSPEEFRKLTTRVVDLHPITCMQNARTSAGGVVTGVPRQALTVGPVQTWKAEKVSIWHAGTHDNPFGQRLTALMISKKIIDSSVPMSLLADHPNVQFNYYRGGFGVCETEMH